MNHPSDKGLKAPIHLIPVEAITGMANAFLMGIEKHGKHKFREGIQYTELIDSIMRHTLAFLNGEDNDKESGMPHTWHIGANFAMLEYQRVHHKELDDRYKNKFQEELKTINNDIAKILKEKNKKELALK